MSLKINGSRVREARLFKGFTITELSKKIGVSKQMLSKYEQHQYRNAAKNCLGIEISYTVLH